MIKTRLILASGAALILSAACTDEVPEIPASELYTREFVKEFGVIDGCQDWNNASRGSVQVNTATSSRVRVTAVIGTHNYLLADYEDVQGKRTLDFDIPKGVTDITVSNGVREIDTKVGGSVDFTSESRGGTNAGGDDFVTVTDITAEANKSKWLTIPWIDAKRFTRKMPEGCYNGNRPGVSTDFMFTTTGTSIIIRPLYWDTSSLNTLGIYYLDEQGKRVEVPVYTVEKYISWNPGEDIVYTFVESDVKHFVLRDEDEAVKKAFGGRKLSELPVQDNVTETSVGPTTLAAISEITKALVPMAKEHAKNVANVPYNYLYRWTNKDLGGLAEGEFEEGCWVVYYTYLNNRDPMGAYAEGGTSSAPPAGYSWPSLRTKGVQVTFKEPGVHFGAYIDCGGKKYYSIASRNPDQAYEPVGERTGGTYEGVYKEFKMLPDQRQSHASTWKGTKYGWTYLGFEDWPNGDFPNGGKSSDMDLNDLVFLVEGVDPDQEIKVVPNKNKAKPIRWLIACEDLGNTGDFDFNDVVFEIEHVSGQGLATITPLAAGGTMETYLMRKNIDGTDEVVGGEWHAQFEGSPYTEIINTTKITKTAKPIDIEVRSDFSLASSTAGTGTDENANYKNNMGGFYLKVIKDGKSETAVTPPGVGDAPQMILIYQGADSKWCWPFERHKIKDAYLGFESWMKDKKYSIQEEGQNWFDKAETGQVVSR